MMAWDTKARDPLVGSLHACCHTAAGYTRRGHLAAPGWGPRPCPMGLFPGLVLV